MAMKMDRRAFLKTSAAVAVAVSMTGLLGGCGGGVSGTDFGGFTASAVKWDVQENKPKLSEDQTKWNADVTVWVRATNLTNSDINILAGAFMKLTVDGVAAEMQSGGLLANDKTIPLSRKHKSNEGWITFKLNYEQKELYDAIYNKKAVVKFSIGTQMATETYTALYDEGLTLQKDTVLA